MIIETPADFAIGQREIQKKVGEYLRIAERKFGRGFPFPQIRYGLKGSVGGTARATGNGVLNFHPTFIRTDFEHYLKQTVGHEVAHLVTRWVYGPEVDSHGIQWKGVMGVFNLPPTRCHQYDVKEAPAIKQRIRRPVIERVVGARIVNEGRNGLNLRVTTFDD